MRFLILLLLISLHAASQKILIRNINIVDVEKGQIQENQSVLIANKKIISVAKNIADPKDATIIEGKGKFLCPGFWDMHVHAIVSYKSMLPLLVAYGITGVREMGTEFVDTMVYLRRMVNEQKIVGPSIYGTGPVLDGVPTILKPGLDFGLRTPAEARHAVDSIAAKGVDFLKVYEMLSPEVFSAIATSAKEKNLPFVGHLPVQVDMITAVNAGMKSIEHLTGFEATFTSKSDSIRAIETEMIRTTTSSNGLQLLAAIRRKRFAEAYGYFNAQKADEICALLKSRNVYITPTLGVLLRFARRDDLVAQQSGADKYIDAQTKSGWNRQWDNLLKDTAFAASEKRAQYLLMITKVLHEHGVAILAGTDTPNSWIIPGFSLHREFQYLSEAGFSNADILRTATINPARFMNKENETGSIVVGKFADLVILTADPLANISNTQKIDGVILKGKFFSKEELEQMKLSAAGQ